MQHEAQLAQGLSMQTPGSSARSFGHLTCVHTGGWWTIIRLQPTWTFHPVLIRREKHPRLLKYCSELFQFTRCYISAQMPEKCGRDSFSSDLQSVDKCLYKCSVRPPRYKGIHSFHLKDMLYLQQCLQCEQDGQIAIVFKHNSSVAVFTVYIHNTAIQKLYILHIMDKDGVVE